VQVSDKTTIQKTKKSMKKTKILSLVSLGAFLLTTSGCTDYDFDSKYEDPSKVTQVTISNLMVGVFQKVKDYDVYEYNRFFGFDSQFTGKYAQTFGYSNTTDMYTPGYIPAIDGQWDNVYSALAQFRKLESLYKEESAAEQAQDVSVIQPTITFIPKARANVTIFQPSRIPVHFINLILMP
jgi:hypothetical protein